MAAERLACAIAHRLGAGDAALGKMLHQSDEKGQISRLHPLFVEGEDELASRGAQQEV
jgi:hypothetical protein